MSGPPARSVETARVESVRDGRRVDRVDSLVVEEPLEIRIRHGPDRRENSLGLTMRTPGHDEELVAGFLLGEGVIAQASDLRAMLHGNDRDGMPDPNVLVADLDPSVAYAQHTHERANVRTSACGVCGRATLDALRERRLPTLSAATPEFPDDVLRTLPERLRSGQAAFAATGGLHAAALFTPEGEIVAIREDVGRHNAVDKLVGSRLMGDGVPVTGHGLLVSGRAGYEILQKARVAGIPLVAAIGAPSSLAVQLADEFGQTLVGFLKRESFNVYAHGKRIT